MHFPFTLLCALLIFCSLTFFFVKHLGHYAEEDVRKYKELVLGGNAENGTTYTSSQQRIGIQKDIFYTQGKDRLKLLLVSDAADLHLEAHEGRFEVIEKMNDVKCCLQEGLSVEDIDETNAIPVQKIFFLKADTASYNYKSEMLIADNIKGRHYLAVGHVLDHIPEPIKTFELCSARHLEMSLATNEKGDEHDKKGKTIVLQGDAFIENEIGTISAEEIKSFPGKGVSGFDSIELTDHVHLKLKEGGELLCAKAFFDFNTLKGTFSGQTEDGYVVYKENCNRKNCQGILALKSHQMQVLLARAVKGSNNKRIVIEEMTGEGDVSINFDNEYVANADHAQFKRAVDSPKDTLQGVVTLYSAMQQGQLCSVSSKSGSLIHANKIEIDTSRRELTFEKPQGKINGYGLQRLTDIDFTSDTLSWNDSTSELVLQGHVIVDQSGIGRLQNQEQVRLSLLSEQGNKALKSIDTTGDSVLTYIDETNGFSHILKCYGPLKVDHVKMETKMYSPKDVNGKVIEGKQVYFEDPKGDIYANNALVQYSQVEGKLTPTKVILAGNVKIANRLPSIEDPSKTVPQYILADRVEFYPQTKEMIFKASKNRRVLFFDKVNTLELSAPGLKIIRDSATKKEQIQGLGDVRFSFVEPEFEQLRERFSLDKTEFPSQSDQKQEKL